MTARSPVEFTKILADGNVQRCGNEVDVTGMAADFAALAAAIQAQLNAMQAALLAGLNPVVADQGAANTIPWTVEGPVGGGEPLNTRPNCVRADLPTLHRNGVTSVDKMADLANTDLTTADNGAGTGSLNASTTYYLTVIPYNQWGPCKVATTINTQVTAAYGANTGSIRASWASWAGATGYDLFLSTDAAPKWVARVTALQHVTGGYEVTAVGTVAAGGGNPAGSIDINVPGTGIQTSNAVFAQNNAYQVGGLSPFDASFTTYVRMHVRVVLTDLRSAPSLTLVPFFMNSATSANWHAGGALVVSLLNDNAQVLEREFTLETLGAQSMMILVGGIAGQGTAVSIWLVGM